MTIFVVGIEASESFGLWYSPLLVRSVVPLWNIMSTMNVQGTTPILLILNSAEVVSNDELLARAPVSITSEPFTLMRLLFRTRKTVVTMMVLIIQLPSQCKRQSAASCVARYCCSAVGDTPDWSKHDHTGSRPYYSAGGTGHV